MFCQCGCGEKTWVPTYNSRPLGYVKGVPCKWKAGHAARFQARRSIPELLEQHQVDDATGCWNALVVRRDGYGQLSLNGAQWRAHRFYYEQLVGPIPEGLAIDHLCRNRACCNPAHLEPVTSQENIRRSSHAKLDPEKVREIRKLAADGWKLSDVGRAYGISGQQAGHVAARKSWADVL